MSSETSKGQISTAQCRTSGILSDLASKGATKKELESPEIFNEEDVRDISNARGAKVESDEEVEFGYDVRKIEDEVEAEAEAAKLGRTVTDDLEEERKWFMTMTKHEKLANYRGRAISLSRFVNFPFFVQVGIHLDQLIDEMGWRKMCSLEEPIYMDVVRVFYSNLDLKEKDVLHTSIGKVLFTTTEEEITKFLELPKTDNMIEDVQKEEVHRRLTEEGRKEKKGYLDRLCLFNFKCCTKP